MNQLKKIIGILIAIPAIASASSDDNFRVINGTYKVKDTVVTEKLKINGEVVLGQGTVVNEMMIINGILNAEGADFKRRLIVNGNASIKQSKFHENASFNGNLTVSDSEFLGYLYLHVQQSDYFNCRLNYIFAEKNPYTNAKEIIFLKNGSLVNGDVMFESGNGEIHLDANSQIKGKIYGGSKIFS